MGSLYDVRKPPHQRTMGIELECIIKNWPEWAVTGFWQFWYFTTDNSIDAPFDKFGAEIISQPLPKDALINQINRLWKKMGGWEHNRSCGIHVHVSRKMMARHRAELLRLAMCRMSDAELTKLFGRGRNSYNDPQLNESKYCSVNMKHSATYEFRMFSSGDADWACECVRRAHLLATYKGEFTYDKLCQLFGINTLTQAFRIAAHQ